MVRTRLATQNSVIREIDSLSDLDSLHARIKPLLADFVYVLKKVISEYDYNAVADIVPLITECLGKFSDNCFESENLNKCLSVSELDREQLIKQIDREKKKYEELMKHALAEEESTVELSRELTQLRQDVSLLQQSTNDTIVSSNPASKIDRQHYKKQFNLKTQNSFEVLHDLSDDTDNLCYAKEVHKRQPLSKHKASSSQTLLRKKLKDEERTCGKIGEKQCSVKQKKVILLTDSHGKMMEKYLSRALGATYSVCAFVRPGAPAANVVGDIAEVSAQLSNQDLVVIVGGTNDVGGNSEQNVVRTLVEAAKSVKSPTVVIASVPYRYDKTEMNYKIKHINDELADRAIENFVYFNSNNELWKKHYTKHGLHLTNVGKIKFCYFLSKCIENVKSKGKSAPSDSLLGPCYEYEKIDNYEINCHAVENGAFLEQQLKSQVLESQGAWKGGGRTSPGPLHSTPNTHYT